MTALASTEIASERHLAQKGAVELCLYRKRVPTIDSAPVVILVHGSSLCALPSFDLDVPGTPDYSMMDWLARRGFDVWSLDHEGYGRSTITESNADIACGVADLHAACATIRTIAGKHAVHLYGMSSGALRAGAYAAQEPDAVSRLVLDAFVWTGKDSPTLAKRREGLELFQKQARRPIDRAFIASIFTRDREGTSERAAIEACADAQLAYGDSVPTGTYLDMTQNLPLVDPHRVASPTLIVRGEYDGIASEEDILEFFRLLGAREKQFSVIPGLAHCTPLGIHRHRMWRAVATFLRAHEA